MDYNLLLSMYNALLIENKNLKEKNDELKRKLELKNVSKTPISEPEEINFSVPELFPNSKVTKNSRSNEKINLFMSLFHGREDVFAKRWHSPTTNKSGYQPKCQNEWDMILCNKKKYKCNVCPNRKLLLLTEKDIESHLIGKDPLGRDVIGIYPLLQDENCYFLAVDFDEADYQKDIMAFRSACAEKGVFISVERSRSGNGAHAWIFFEESISAHTSKIYVQTANWAYLLKTMRNQTINHGKTKNLMRNY